MAQVFVKRKDGTWASINGPTGPRGATGPIGPRGLAPVTQPVSEVAKPPAHRHVRALPEIVACPNCGEEQNLKVVMGNAFGISPSVTSGCPACHRQFDVDGDSVYLRCDKCGFHEDADHVCEVNDGI